MRRNYNFGEKVIKFPGAKFPRARGTRCAECDRQFVPIRRYHRYCPACWSLGSYRIAVEQFLGP